MTLILPPSSAPRDPQRGTVTILVAAISMGLFAMAALAVDAGYWYQARAGLQNQADAAVMAGLPSLATSQSTAKTNAKSIALAAYPSATVNATPTSSSLTVTISATQRSFFGSIFGLSTKPMTVTAVGQMTAPAPAILALGNCTTTGVSINGSAALTINGAVESNGPLSYQTGPVTTTTTGNVQSNCGVPSSNGAWNTFSSAPSQSASAFSDPFSAISTSSFTCTVGSVTTSRDIQYSDWVGSTLPPGIYCSSGSMNLTSPVGTSFTAVGVTLVSMGSIQIGASSASTWSAATGSPQNIVAYALGSGGGPAINLGNNSLTVTGSIYAPNGLINAGGANMVVDGSLIGQSVELGNYGAWTIDPSLGGGAGTYYLSQ